MTKDKPLPRELFNSIYSKIPRLCIDLLIKSKQGILLTKRAISPYGGLWHLPGGTVYFKENLKDAAKRIAKRELNLAIEPKKFLGYIEFIEKRHAVSAVFLIEIKSGYIKLNEEATEFSFFKKIPKTTVPSHYDFLRKHKF